MLFKETRDSSTFSNDYSLSSFLILESQIIPGENLFCNLSFEHVYRINIGWSKGFCYNFDDWYTYDEIVSILQW